MSIIKAIITPSIRPIIGPIVGQPRDPSKPRVRDRAKGVDSINVTIQIGDYKKTDYAVTDYN